MQSLRNGERRFRAVLSQPHSPSLIHCRRASFMNPFAWVKEKLGAGLREKPTQKELEAGKLQAQREGTANVFEAVPVPTKKALKRVTTPLKPKPTSHKYSTANFKISHRKLNMIGQQISGKPIDYAILQMQFSEKRASTRIMNMLVTAKDHASRYKQLKEPKLIVAEAWVTKGPRQPGQLEPRGRGHYGIRTHPNSKMTVVLKEGKTLEQQKAEKRKKQLRKVVSAALAREDRPIRNPAPTWGW